jgi:mono/diheme cytochrome c family protein
VAEAPEEGLMKRVAIWSATAAALALGGQVLAADVPVSAATAPGEAVYQRWCVHCHAAGRGNPGTESLQVKYGGKVPAVLLERTDLAPQAVSVFVRQGVLSMAPFRKTEITDAELAALSAFVAKGYTGR